MVSNQPMIAYEEYERLRVERDAAVNNADYLARRLEEMEAEVESLRALLRRARLD